MSRLQNYGLTEASDTAYDLHIITPDFMIAGMLTLGLVSKTG